MPPKTTIQCPKCGTQIDVNEILYHQLEEEMKRKFEGEVDEHRKKYKAAMDEFKAKENAFKEEQEKFDERLRENVSIQLKAERQALTDKLKKSFRMSRASRWHCWKKRLPRSRSRSRSLTVLKRR